MATRGAVAKTVVRPTRKNGGAAPMTRRQAAAKAILGDLAVIDQSNSDSMTRGNGGSNDMVELTQTTLTSIPSKRQQPTSSEKDVIPMDMEIGDPFKVLEEIDPRDSETLQMALEDLEREVRKRQESITLKAQQLCSEQQQAYFVATMKIPKNIRNMKVREFNQQFGTDVFKFLQKIRDDASSAVSGITASDSVKRAKGRPPTSTANISVSLSTNAATRGPAETPARFGAGSRPAPTPGSLRTVRRGEKMYSANGSPVDQAETGELIATITKKKKKTRAASSGNEKDGEEEARAVLDINVGDGRFLDLAEPGNIDILDESMKEEALQQLKILQEQINSLVTNLHDS